MSWLSGVLTQGVGVLIGLVLTLIILVLLVYDLTSKNTPSFAASQ